MFGYIRLAIGLVIFVALFLLIRKSKIVRKVKLYILSGIVALAVTITLSFLPFENLFVTFDSPQAVYRYVRDEKLENEIVVEGENCAMIVNQISSGETETFFVEKASNGWKISIGFNSETDIYVPHGELLFWVQRYKKTNEYFVYFSIDGEKVEISDKYDSTFYTITEYNKILKEQTVTYYANIPEFSLDYFVVINGTKIKLQD